MRVLVLTYETPAWPAAGGPARKEALLAPLAGRHQVRVLSTGGTPSFGTPPAGVDIQLVEPGPEPTGPAPGGWLERNFGHYVFGPPWQHRLAAHHCEALARELPRQLEEWRPDVVELDHGELARILPSIPPALPTVLVLENLLTQVQAQRVRRSLDPRRVLQDALEVGVMLRQERHDMLAADVAVVVSEVDLRRARRMAPGARLQLVPNCVDLGRYAGSEPRAASPTAVMTASFHYPPNQVAAAALLELWPRVRAVVPDARLVLAGQRVPASLRAGAAGVAGVALVEDPPDVRPLLRQAWLALAPLEKGSGSPLKVIEAMASGVAVVTSPRVAAALGVGRGEGVVAPPRRELAGAIATLLRHGDAALELGRAARHAAESRFDSVAASRELERAWELAVRRRLGRRADA